MKSSNKKGQVAGLGILLSIVVTIFIVGLLVFIFNYMGSEIEQEVPDVVSEYTNATGSVAYLSKVYMPGGALALYNTSNNTRATPTIINPLAYNVTGTQIDIQANYSSAEIRADYDAMGTTAEVMNETRSSLRSTTDWFGIIIVIGAMVVLILLTALIIRAIRGSGGIASSVGGEKGSA